MPAEDTPFALETLRPEVARHLPRVRLGCWPTPIERAGALEAHLGIRGSLRVKRDDRSATIYGGNKVRTLEVLLAHAMHLAVDRIVAVGAAGSNHVVATALHAEAVGLRAGALLFPQPPSLPALENAELVSGLGIPIEWVSHWAALGWGVVRWRLRARRAERVWIMPPGGAMPLGAMGYVSAALELAMQLESDALGMPDVVVLPVGSTCTTAGLLAGFHLARRWSVGALSTRRAPRILAVRVTPWPITSRMRIARLASRTLRLLSDWLEEPEIRASAAELAAGLEVDGAELGDSYGTPTIGGAVAERAWRRHAGLFVDAVYSAKAASGLARRLALRDGAKDEHYVFWLTKSSMPLAVPSASAPEVQGADGLAAWIREARRSVGADDSTR